MLDRLPRLARVISQKSFTDRPAAPSPALVDLQARYVATADFANRAATDEDGIPAANAAAALSYAILGTPSANLADLLVKARHAAEYLEPGGKGDPSYDQSLDTRAWRGLLSDIERLATSSTNEVADRPYFGTLTNHNGQAGRACAELRMQGL
jgi:hypothetical protein